MPTDVRTITQVYHNSSLPFVTRIWRLFHSSNHPYLWFAKVTESDWYLDITAELFTYLILSHLCVFRNAAKPKTQFGGNRRWIHPRLRNYMKSGLRRAMKSETTWSEIPHKISCSRWITRKSVQKETSRNNWRAERRRSSAPKIPLYPRTLMNLESMVSRPSLQRRTRRIP